MNITLVNKTIIFLIVILFAKPLLSQSSDSLAYQDEFGITVEMLGGMSYNLKSYKIKSKRLNISPSLRILWDPNRNLNIGLETTYLLIGKSEEDKGDEYLGKGKFDAKLEALPVYLVFNMRLFALDWIAGIGASYMRSSIIYNKEETISTNWYYCFTFGIGYTFNITKHFGIGLESRIFSLTKTNDFIGAGYFKLVYHIIY